MNENLIKYLAYNLGISKSDLTCNIRKPKFIYARTIASKYMRKDMNFCVKEICKVLNKSRFQVEFSLKNYESIVDKFINTLN